RRHTRESRRQRCAVREPSDARAVERRERGLEENVAQREELGEEDAPAANVSLVDVIDEGERGKLAGRLRLGWWIERRRARAVAPAHAAREKRERRPENERENERLAARGVRSHSE